MPDLRRESIFLCPRCREPLSELRCVGCGARASTLDGIPILVDRLERDRILDSSPNEPFLRFSDRSSEEILSALLRDPSANLYSRFPRLENRMLTRRSLRGGHLRADWRLLAPPPPPGPIVVLESGWGDASLGLSPLRREIWAGFRDPFAARLAARRIRERSAKVHPFLFDGRNLPIESGTVALLVVHQPGSIFAPGVHLGPLLAKLLKPGGILYLEEESRSIFSNLLREKGDWVWGGPGLRNRTREVSGAGMRVLRRIARLPDLAEPRIQFDLDDGDSVRHLLADPPSTGRGRRLLQRWVRRFAAARFYASMAPSYGIVARRGGTV